MDELQWEVNRLAAENAKLRANDPEASELVDCAAELERARREAAEWMERAHELERGLEAKTQEAADAEERAERAEAEAVENGAGDLGEEALRAAGGRTETAELRAKVQERDEELARAQRELGTLDARLVEHERQSRATKETLLQRAEVERYRALESERLKWEARETRLFRRIETLEEELQTTRMAAADKDTDGQLRARLRGLTKEADNLVASLREAHQAGRGLPERGLRRSGELQLGEFSLKSE